jgi:hypothetical protein
MRLDDIVDTAVDTVTTMLNGMRRLFVIVFVIAIAIALGSAAVCALAGDYGYVVQLGAIGLVALGASFLVGKW